jgi:hypothetical protein
MIQNHEPIWFNEEQSPQDTKKEAGYSLFVATPVHSECSIHYAQALLNLQKYCFKKNVKLWFQIMKSSLVTQGRNMCVSAFLQQKKATHLLFVDSDISFNESAPERLVACDKDVISIPYPLKDMNWDKGMHMINEGKIKEAKDLRNKGFYRYPMKVEDNSAIKIKNGVIKVEHSPTGFMLIKREVILKMIKAYPEMRIDQEQIINGKNEKLPDFWNFFDTQFDPVKHTYTGEDFAFCQRWKDIGGECHAWIMDHITHIGEHQYTGRFADELIKTD